VLQLAMMTVFSCTVHLGP